ncbi:MAG: hypothetical protein IPP87_13360 [Ideonella sp.]|nr:hypothetical protein [Ideonella sp.]
MASVTLNSTIFERLAAGLYGIQLGSATLVEATNAALFLSTVEPGSDGVNTLANVLYKRDFGNQSDHAVAVSMVANMGITGALATSSVTLVENALGGVNADHKGEVVMTIINKLSAAEADATYGASAKAFNLQVKAALDYAAHNVGDVTVKSLLPIFHLDPMTAAGADSMRLTGNEDVTINFTDPANQITGMDLNGDGIIKADGVENHITGKAADFEIVDAYSRNPLNHGDTANNFLGDIEFHGEGFDGDGTNTDGNIVLGGLGIDNIFGGIGNDFLAGGNVAQGRDGYDMLHGGRNADFFFAEFNPIRSTDGKQLYIDGGSTADDTAAGTHSSQDSDWLLFEATDDDEPVTVLLEEESLTLNPFDDVDVTSRSGKSMDVEDVENFDASGNLYGFLDGVNVKIGARAVDGRDTSDAAVGSNYGYGSSAQLYVSGSEVGNIIVGGYDNDRINGNGGDDLLMGGNLNFLKNPNLANIWNNGQDEIYGGAGDDNIVFETDGGIYEGGWVANNDKDKFDNNDSDTSGGDDTLWLTREAFGKKSAGDVTSDGTLRIDLAVGKEGGIDNAAGYGGADKAARTGNYTADQTNYKAGFARAQVQDMDNVIATGLGAVDYLAAGTNDPELQFANQQNHFAFSGNLDLRGTAGDNILYAVDGSDVIEGRQGNDSLSGGNGNDDFYFTLAGEDGDGVDVIHRQSDVNGDNLWDTDADGNGLYEKDFGQAGAAVTANSKLTLTLTDAAHPSDLTGFPVNGVVFKLDGVSYTVSLASGTQSTYAAFKDGLNAALDANATLARLNAVLNGDNTITITDPNGKTFVSVGYTFIDNVVPPAGTLTWNQLVGDPSSSQSKDRLIYKAYEDRLDNEGVDDDSYLGSTISLGVDSYAEDLVIGFADEDGNGKATTRIAEDQAYTLRFTNLTTQDKVQVVVNGVKYSLQVGVDLDGNIIADEDGVGDSQTDIQAAFLQRLNDFINSFMDDDTSAGAVDLVRRRP